MANIEPSKSVRPSLGQWPYGWLTITALLELLYAAFFLLGTTVYAITGAADVPGGGVGPAIYRPPVSEIITTAAPFLAGSFSSVAGAALLLNRQKIGMHLSAAGLVVWNAYLLWLWPPQFYYDGLKSPASLGAFIFLPLLALPLVTLAIGWKKVKWHQDN